MNAAATTEADAMDLIVRFKCSLKRDKPAFLRNSGMLRVMESRYQSLQHRKSVGATCERPHTELGNYPNRKCPT